MHKLSPLKTKETKIIKVSTINGNCKLTPLKAKEKLPTLNENVS